MPFEIFMSIQSYLTYIYIDKTLKGLLFFYLIFLITCIGYTQAQQINSGYLPFLITPGMKDKNTKDHVIIIESNSNKIDLSYVLDFVKHPNPLKDSLKIVDTIYNGKNNYWLLLPFTIKTNENIDIAYHAWGSQLDSIWVLDENYNTTQKHKIPLNNFKLDLTDKIKVADLKGLGLRLQTREKYIMMHLKHYGYSEASYPHITDATIYSNWYLETHFTKFIFFLFLTGIELGLIIYLTIQFILLRRNYLLWYVIYVIAQTLPNLDYLLWSFSEAMPLPYSWFHFKMFHLCSIVISYLLFIKSMLDKEIKAFNYTYYTLAGICFIFFFTDLLLLFNHQDYYSYFIYSILRSTTSISCLLILLYLLITEKVKNIKLLLIGTLILLSSEMIGWFLLYNIRSYIINIGILVEFIFFTYVLSLKIKNMEKETILIKDQNYKLIEEQNEIKQSIARDLHDEVGSIITKLNLQLQLDKEKQHNVNEKNSLQKYQWSVQKISLGLKDLINVISEENTNFKELVASTRTLVNEYFENTNLTIHFTENISTIKGQNDQIGFKLKRTIHAMVKEILQNILKHSQADTIWFDIQMTNNNSLSFAVSDNGIGFNYSFNLQGHGLKNIEKRTTDINAQLSIVSHPGSGTTIKVEIPLKSTNGPFHY